jgi:hypothetical protein
LGGDRVRWLLDVEDDGVEGLDIVRHDEGDSFDVQRTAVGLFSVRFTVAHIAMAVAGRTKEETSLPHHVGLYNLFGFTVPGSRGNPQEFGASLICWCSSEIFTPNIARPIFRKYSLFQRHKYLFAEDHTYWPYCRRLLPLLSHCVGRMKERFIPAVSLFKNLDPSEVFTAVCKTNDTS